MYLNARIHIILMCFWATIVSAANRRLSPIACSPGTDQEDDVSSSSSSGEYASFPRLDFFSDSDSLIDCYDLNFASEAPLKEEKREALCCVIII